jgi:hypothetical protein
LWQEARPSFSRRNVLQWVCGPRNVAGKALLIFANVRDEVARFTGNARRFAL